MSAGRFRPFLKVEFLDLWRLIDEHKLKPGMYTREPVLLTDRNWAILKLENLQPPSGGLDRRESRGEDLRIVEDEEVAASQESGQIAKGVVPP